MAKSLGLEACSQCCWAVVRLPAPGATDETIDRRGCFSSTCHVSHPAAWCEMEGLSFCQDQRLAFGVSLDCVWDGAISGSWGMLVQLVGFRSIAAARMASLSLGVLHVELCVVEHQALAWSGCVLSLNFSFVFGVRGSNDDPVDSFLLVPGDWPLASDGLSAMLGGMLI